jgi:hypothetical protein
LVDRVVVCCLGAPMRHLACLLLLAPIACAHLPPPPASSEEGQRAASLYLKTLRWEGARASAQLIAPELQAEYLGRIRSEKLEDKLKVTEFETKELSRLGPDALAVSADLSWYLEPEVTVRHEVISLRLRYRGAWMVDAIEGGPLALAPLVPEVVDGGAR